MHKTKKKIYKPNSLLGLTVGISFNYAGSLVKILLIEELLIGLFIFFLVLCSWFLFLLIFLIIFHFFVTINLCNDNHDIPFSNTHIELLNLIRILWYSKRTFYFVCIFFII